MNLQGGIHCYIIEGSCATRHVIFKDTLPYTSAYNCYIARTLSGDFLQIWRTTAGTGEDSSLETHTTYIEMFKVDFDKQYIVNIDGLKDDALLIGHNFSCCLSTADYPGLRPNHVYFTDDDEYSLIDDQDNPRGIGMYNLEDDTVVQIVSPQPWLNWPVPIWIMLNFTKIHK